MRKASLLILFLVGIATAMVFYVGAGTAFAGSHYNTAGCSLNARIGVAYFYDYDSFYSNLNITIYNIRAGEDFLYANCIQKEKKENNFVQECTRIESIPLPVPLVINRVEKIILNSEIYNFDSPNDASDRLFEFYRSYVKNNNITVSLSEGAVLCMKGKIREQNIDSTVGDYLYSRDVYRLSEDEDGSFNDVSKLFIFDKTKQLFLRCSGGKLVVDLVVNEEGVNCVEMNKAVFLNTSSSSLAESLIAEKPNFDREIRIKPLVDEEVWDEVVKYDIPGATCGAPDSIFSFCCDPQRVSEYARKKSIDSLGPAVKIPGIRGVVNDILDNIFSDDLGFYTTICGDGAVAVEAKGNDNGDLQAEKDEVGRYILFDLNDNKPDRASANCMCISLDEYEDNINAGEESNLYLNSYNSCKGVLENGSDEVFSKCILELNKCEDGIPTAFGCIAPTLQGFINDLLFKIGLSLAGVFTFLCLLYGAFLIKISAGNADRINKGKELIKNCLVGLLFIVFSVFILNFIRSLLGFF